MHNCRCPFAAIHGDQFHSRANPGLIGGRTHDYIIEFAVLGHGESQRISEVRKLKYFFRRLREHVWMVVVYQFPTVPLDASQRSVSAGCSHTLLQQSVPIVGSDLIERAYNVVELVRHNKGRAALTTVEAAAEVIERMLIVRLLADDRVDFEPNQFAFGIVIQAATPTRPLLPLQAKSLNGARGIFYGTPGADV